jgi:hypothetical protein
VIRNIIHDSMSAGRIALLLSAACDTRIACVELTGDAVSARQR